MARGGNLVGAVAGKASKMHAVSSAKRAGLGMAAAKAMGMTGPVSAKAAIKSAMSAKKSLDMDDDDFEMDEDEDEKENGVNGANGGEDDEEDEEDVRSSLAVAIRENGPQPISFADERRARDIVATILPPVAAKRAPVRVATKVASKSAPKIEKGEEEEGEEEEGSGKAAPGELALRDIALLQGLDSKVLLMRRLPFQRLVRDILQEDAGRMDRREQDHRLQPDTVAALHEAAENYLVDFMFRLNQLAEQAGRETIEVRDIKRLFSVTPQELGRCDFVIPDKFKMEPNMDFVHNDDDADDEE